MARPPLAKRLWKLIAPLLPPAPPKPKGGRPRIDGHAALTGLLVVLMTGLPGEDLLWELCYDSGMMCGRRLRYGQAAGTRHTSPRRCSTASTSGTPSLGRGRYWFRPVSQRTRERVDRPDSDGPRPPGSKRHRVGDAQAILLASRSPAGAPRPAATTRVLEEVMDAIPPITQLVGRSRRRPATRHADKASDLPRGRQACRPRGITPCLARRGIESCARLGRHRWVVERSLAWLARYRRLTIRYERRVDLS